METPKDCSYKKDDLEAVLENSKIAIRFDCHNGTITGLLNKTTGVSFIGKGTHEVFRLVHSRYDLHGAQTKDPWSAAYGTLIQSSAQQVSEIRFAQTEGGARLEVHYDRLRLERRTINVKLWYTIELQDDDEETHWKLYIQNDDPGTIREVHFPFLVGLEPMDALIMPNQGGQKLTNPMDKLSDEISQISLEYPARASMQWFEYYSVRAGLYMASYDKELGYTRLYFGRPEGRMDVAMWIVKYPFSVSETTWESPILAVGVHAGDWHWGADRYRSWTKSWISQPRIFRNVKEMIVGCGEFLVKDEKEQLINRYEDIIRIVEQNQWISNAGSFMAVGWFDNGHDTNYPEYQPIEELGGEKALVDAIDRVHSMGARINAYVNARLACIDTKTYKKYGKNWSVLTKAPGLGVTEIGFAELHEDWNRNRPQEHPSAKWFAVMCPAVKAWQDHLVTECVRIIKEYHFDGLFLDQPGSYWAELCYNREHGHRNPATAWGPGYLDLFRRIREAVRQVKPDCVLYTEGMNDAYGQFLDYHMDKNPTWEPMKIHPEMETFVEMWRYTLPDQIIINYPRVYSFPPSQNRIDGENYHFVLGIRGQLFIHANFSKQSSDEVSPMQKIEQAKRQAVVEKIQRLWVKGGENLFYGRFMDNIGLSVSNPNALAKGYLGKNGISIPIWNTTEEEAILQVTVELEALGLPTEGRVEVHSLDSDETLPYLVQGSYIEISENLKAHEIDVIVIDIKP